MGYVTEPTPWSATLTTSADTTFNASDYSDGVPGLALFVFASQPYWFFKGTWVEGTTNNPTPGAAGRGTLLPAGGFTFANLPDDAQLKFRDFGNGCAFNGIVTAS